MTVWVWHTLGCGLRQPDGFQRVLSSMPEQANEAALLQRIGSAAAVAVGRVTEVRKPAQIASEASSGHRPISEHDPGIAEAVIEVSEGIKGTEAGKKLLVRFPTSRDVRWYSYPKFAVGDSGVFILQPDAFSAGIKAMAATAEGAVYNVSRSQDVLPAGAAERVKGLVERSQKSR